MKHSYRKITSPLLSLLSVLAVLFSGTAAFASVTVSNVLPGATSWSGTPIAASVSNPSGDTSVAEGFSSANTSYAETFTVPVASSYVLDRICLYAGGGSGTSAAATLTISLYDLGGQVAPNPSGYTAGTNLLGGGNGLPITYVTQTNGVLQLDFTGSDRVTLIAGRLYAFEISSTGGGSPISWLRGITDTFTGGAGYRNRSWINGSNARDFALAVYGTQTATPPTSSTINAAVTHQVIDGFGAGTAFLDSGIQRLTDAQMDALYGTGANQMGLTLIRVRISPNGPSDWGDPIANGQKAHLRGAKILATPWTPPASMKSNGSTIHGSLLPAQYQNYVDFLNSFTDTMAANGAPVDVVSLQNEPDYDPTYEGCLWTAEQFQNFCRDFAGGIKVPVMMPESYGYKLPISDATLNDPLAAANVDYVGEHLYGATIRDYPLARSLGKHIWMTEYLENDQTIGSAIGTAKQIQDCLSVASMSGYIWWKTIGDANGLLNASGTLQRRAYVMGQFSRFIRPGDLRIDVPVNDSSLGITAFKNPVSGGVTIVAVNGTGAAINHTFNLQGLAVTTVTPWVTSAIESLTPHTPITVSNGSFAYSFPATSMVTFVAGSTAPTIVSSPKGHSVEVGSTAVLEVEALGEYLNYQWKREGVALTGATARILSLSNLQVADTGNYTVVVSNSVGQVTSAAAALTVSVSGNPGHLSSIATRSPVGTGDGVQIGGFVITGSSPKPVLIRAAGPALTTELGMSGTIVDPTIDLYDQLTHQLLTTNDNWSATLVPLFKQLWALSWPTGSKDAAISTTLAPGAYSALVSGKNDGTGIGMVEIYDASSINSGSRLAGLASRTLVGADDNVQIAGLVISGSTARTVVIRASGPALNKLTGLGGTLADPMIELVNLTTHATVATNDDWDASLAPHFANVFLFPWTAGSKDAALVLTLEPGNYSVIVRGKNRGTGIALIEVYDE